MLAQTYTTTDTASAGVGIVLLLIYLVGLVIGVILFVIAIMNVIDFTKHTDQAWEASGQSKQTALIVIILSFVCCGLLALYYWFSIKPAVTAAEGPGYAG